MKNRLFPALFVLLFGWFAFADGEYNDQINWPITLHPEFECEELVAYLKDNVDSIAENLSGYDSYLSGLQMNFDSTCRLLESTSDYQSSSSLQWHLDTYKYSFNRNSDFYTNRFNEANNITTNLLDRLYQINCAECVMGDPPSGTNSNNCCDFTGLYARLDQLIQIQTQIQTYAQRLQTIDQNLEYSVFLLEHGFQEITNMLSYAGFPNYQVANYAPSSGLNSLRGLRVNGSGFLVYWLSLSSLTRDSQSSGWLPSFWWQNFDQLKVLASLNNFEMYKYENFRVPSPLFRFDQQSTYSDYYTYLTNYYFGMVRGDQDIFVDHRTNWFTRIETLLAALVFSDSSNTDTNTVDSSAGERERTQLSDSVTTANQGASTFNTSFKSASQSITQLYQSYFTTFETAAMPSHIVLMRLSSNEGEDIEVAFQSDSLGILVEGCRVVTTFAWASVGILLLYKFLVWAGRCIVVTCQFIYRVISSVFKS